jgi:hypothetical protein
MSKFRIDANESFYTEITVNESDKYSKLVYMKFERNYVDEGRRGIDEMFITPKQLKELGEFLIDQSNRIISEQEIKERSESSKNTGIKGFAG